MSIQKELNAHLAAIAKLVAELERDADTYRRMMEAAGKGGKPKSNGTRIPRKALSPDTILAALKERPLALGELVVKTGGSKAAVSYALNKLRGEKKVRMRGAKRAAKWSTA